MALHADLLTARRGPEYSRVSVSEVTTLELTERSRLLCTHDQLFWVTPTKIFKVDVTTGVVSLYAGSLQGYIDGPLASAHFLEIRSLCAVGDDLFVVDALSIRRISGGIVNKYAQFQNETPLQILNIGNVLYVFTEKFINKEPRLIAINIDKKQTSLVPIPSKSHSEQQYNMVVHGTNIYFGSRYEIHILDTLTNNLSLFLTGEHLGAVERGLTVVNDDLYFSSDYYEISKIHIPNRAFSSIEVPYPPEVLGPTRLRYILGMRNSLYTFNHGYTSVTIIKIDLPTNPAPAVEAYLMAQHRRRHPSAAGTASGSAATAANNFPASSLPSAAAAIVAPARGAIRGFKLNAPLAQSYKYNFGTPAQCPPLEDAERRALPNEGGYEQYWRSLVFFKAIQDKIRPPTDVKRLDPAVEAYFVAEWKRVLAEYDALNDPPMDAVTYTAVHLLGIKNEEVGNLEQAYINFIKGDKSVERPLSAYDCKIKGQPVQGTIMRFMTTIRMTSDELRYRLEAADIFDLRYPFPMLALPESPNTIDNVVVVIARVIDVTKTLTPIGERTVGSLSDCFYIQTKSFIDYEGDGDYLIPGYTLIRERTLPAEVEGGPPRHLPRLPFALFEADDVRDIHPWLMYLLYTNEDTYRNYMFMATAKGWELGPPAIPSNVPQLKNEETKQGFILAYYILMHDIANRNSAMPSEFYKLLKRDQLGFLKAHLEDDRFKDEVQEKLLSGWSWLNIKQANLPSISLLKRLFTIENYNSGNLKGGARRTLKQRNRKQTKQTKQTKQKSSKRTRRN